MDDIATGYCSSCPLYKALVPILARHSLRSFCLQHCLRY
ncbi:zinc-finger domain-containing protein [Vibrio caribbeanicus]